MAITPESGSSRQRGLFNDPEVGTEAHDDILAWAVSTSGRKAIAQHLVLAPLAATCDFKGDYSVEVFKEGHELRFVPGVGRYIWFARSGEGFRIESEELTGQLEADDKLRNYIISSMTYPLILAGVAVLSVVILLAFVVPQFRQIFDSMGDALPFLTRVVLNVSDFVRGHWMLLALVTTIVVFALSRWATSAAGRMKVDSGILRLPLMGNVLRNLQLAIYFRTLGGLLQRGVPLVDALRIASDAVTNTALRSSLEPLVGIVKSGKRLSTGFATEHFSQSSTAQLMRVAEETGDLDGTSLALADRYEEEGRRTMTRLLAAMEPLIIIVLGMIVAVIIVAILGGVLAINDTVGK